jgi:CHAD domain-containing protein
MRTPLLPPPGLRADRRTVASLFTALTVQAGEPVAATWTLYDTPDRRLWAAGLVLVQRARQLSLHRRQRLGSGDPVASLTWRPSKPPRLLDAWPAGPLKQALLPVVQVRALLPLFSCQVERHAGVRLDDQGKTVVRLEAWLVSPEAGGRRLWLAVEGLRGYGREQQAAVGVVRGRGWRKAGDEPMALLAGEMLGEQAREAPDFPDGQAPAGTALRACLRQAVLRLAPLEKGVVEDIDTEFLHHHRVLLRRVRSLTAQFRSVFAEADALRLRAILAGWARCSNPVRDLDVWMLARDEHNALVPDVLRPGLDALFAGIVRDRGEAHRVLAERLSSPVHSAERAELAALLDRAGDGPDAPKVLVRLAAQRTWKAYRRVAAEAATVDAATPSEAVHQVRIRCKKLRYLLDACGPFTAPDDHQRLREQLKAVQAALGAFNDISLQSAALLTRAGNASAATQLAVGALVGALDRQRLALRDQVLLGLAELIAPATRNRYRRLFRLKQE